MRKDIRILVVEDDNNIFSVLVSHFRIEGFKVSRLNSRDVIKSGLNFKKPDVILLDHEKSEFSILKTIRDISNLPVIIISNQADEIDRVLGLELGADDYVCKPFSPREVVSRVKAILRRCHPEAPKEQFIAGPILVDPEAHNALVGENTLKITRVEFELLRIMISQPDHVFTRSELISSIEKYYHGGAERSIDSHIKNLRKKIEAITHTDDIIRTVYGIGYSFGAG
jgi:two-component system, OmpR family, response regulator BaeR